MNRIHRIFPSIIFSTRKAWTSHISQEDGLLLQIIGSLAVLILDRPKVLNSLSLELIRSFTSLLIKCDEDPNIHAILVKGNGGKAFCSGGDIVSITDSARNGGDIHSRFFQEEYCLNHLTSVLRTPYVSLYNGIAMGGGIGISIHGKYRIATENSIFAMPETAIGFHPDVGGSFILPRLSGSLGMFLGLTGYRLKGPDVFHAGIATHYVDMKNISNLEYTLSHVQNIDEVKHVLDILKVGNCNTHSFMNGQTELVNYTFSADTVEEIFERLLLVKDNWSRQILERMFLMSPTSLKVTHKSLSLGAKLTLKQCLQMENGISNNFLQTNDLYEGVRAMLLDKDKKPFWKPNKLCLISNEIVESYFQDSGQLLSFYT